MSQPRNRDFKNRFVLFKINFTFRRILSEGKEIFEATGVPFPGKNDCFPEKWCVHRSTGGRVYIFLVRKNTRGDYCWNTCGTIFLKEKKRKKYISTSCCVISVPQNGTNNAEVSSSLSISRSRYFSKGILLIGDEFV